MTADIVVEVKDRMMIIGLNRADKKNALSLAMYEALSEAIGQGERDGGIDVFLFHGLPDSFSAGNDLRDFLEMKPADPRSTPVVRFMTALAGAKKPVVAAVRGLAIGIGTTMLMHCDLVYASPSTRFQLPFVPLGIVPEYGSTLLLPRMAGYQRAARFLLLGDPFDGETAREIGLVTALCPEDEVLPAARSAAERLIALPQGALRTAKRLMRAPDQDLLRDVILAEIGEVFAALKSAEAKEAFAAYFEKRKPDFSRR